MALASFGIEKDSVGSVGKLSGLNGVLVAFGEKLVKDLGKNLPEKKDTTGALRGSIRFTTKVFGQVYTFELSMLDYYKYVDQGVNGTKVNHGSQYSFRDKFPKILEIKKWISNKNIQDFDEVKTKKGLKTLASDFKGVNRLAFLIGRKIKTKGIEPTHFYSKVIDDGRLKKLSADLTKEAGREIIIDIKHFIHGINSNTA